MRRSLSPQASDELRRNTTALLPFPGTPATGPALIRGRRLAFLLGITLRLHLLQSSPPFVLLGFSQDLPRL